MTETLPTPYEAARLPWRPSIAERFGDLGVTRSTWGPLVEACYPSAKTVESVVMVLAYCQARKLDPFKRPVHIVPVWSSELRRLVDTVWPGISELRTTAMRTGNYAGCDEMEEGPLIEQSLSGVAMRFPEWGRLTIYRINKRGRREKFVGPKTFWLESYATAARDSQAPNAMWKKRPRGQLEKCAEAAALRRAFPEELGSEYAAEEMEGHVLGWSPGLAREPLEADPAPKALHAGFSDKPAKRPPEPREAPIEAEFTELAAEPEPEPSSDDTPEPPANDDFDLIGWAADLSLGLPAYDDVDRLREDWMAHKDRLRDQSPGVFKELNKAVAARAAEIGGKEKAA